MGNRKWEWRASVRPADFSTEDTEGTEKEERKRN